MDNRMAGTNPALRGNSRGSAGASVAVETPCALPASQTGLSLSPSPPPNVVSEHCVPYRSRINVSIPRKALWRPSSTSRDYLCLCAAVAHVCRSPYKRWPGHPSACPLAAEVEAPSGRTSGPVTCNKVLRNTCWVSDSLRLPCFLSGSRESPFCPFPVSAFCILKMGWQLPTSRLWNEHPKTLFQMLRL